MHPNFYLSPLAVCLALTMASSAKAAEPVLLPKVTLQSLLPQFQLIIPGSNHADAATSINSLQFVRQHLDSNNVSHVRMQQKYAGFVVFGGYAILHGVTSANNMLAFPGKVSMNGVVYRDLEADLGSPRPNFVQNGASVLRNFKARHAGKIMGEEQVTPMVYIDDHHKAHWAYKVMVLLTHTDSIPERPTAIIDAATQKPFVEWNDIKTAVSRTPVKGTGFGGNRKTGQFVYGSGLPLLELSRDVKRDECFMENIDVRVVDMMHDYSSKNKAMHFKCRLNPDYPAPVYWTGYGGDGYDRENGANSPTNDALYAGYVIKHMYHDWYQAEALVKEDGSPMQLVMRVHYGEGYENAYWDGRQMTFGDGDTIMHPLVSLGVGAHEISHGFTEQHSGLEYFGQSGGMNESFSDMAAQAAEYYSANKCTWMIASEIMKEDSGYEAVRYMDLPSRDGGSIDRATDYYGGLDVHYSSGVFNRLFYLLSNQSGWDVRMAFDVMVKANMDYWTPLSTFNEGGCGILQAASDLGYPMDSIRKAMDIVDVNYQACRISSPDPDPVPEPQPVPPAAKF